MFGKRAEGRLNQHTRCLTLLWSPCSLTQLVECWSCRNRDMQVLPGTGTKETRAREGWGRGNTRAKEKRLVSLFRSFHFCKQDRTPGFSFSLALFKATQLSLLSWVCFVTAE